MLSSATLVVRFSVLKLVTRLQLILEAACSSEMLVKTYEATWCHDSESLLPWKTQSYIYIYVSYLTICHSWTSVVNIASYRAAESNGNTPDLYWVSIRFDSRMNHRLSWAYVFFFFFGHSRSNGGIRLEPCKGTLTVSSSPPYIILLCHLTLHNLTVET
jgi:hypothetical protein